MRSATLAFLILSTIALLALAGCGGGDKKRPAAATATLAASTTAESTPKATSPEPSATAGVVGPGPAKLISVEVTEVGDHDHVVFTFDKSVDTPHVDSPVGAPTSCGSGETVDVAGDYILEVRFSAAQAHNDDGTPSVAQTSIQPRLPAVLEAVQTCDLEGTVTWVLGIQNVAPVERSTGAGTTHTVDITHP